MRLAAFRGLPGRGVVGVGIATVLLLACQSSAQHSAAGGAPTTGVGGGQVVSGTTSGSPVGGATTGGAATTDGGAPDGSVFDGSVLDGSALDGSVLDGSTPACVATVTSQHLAIPAHDPSMIHAAGGPWYLLVTGGAINVRSSPDLTAWTNAGSLFPSIPAWITTELGQSITDLWAPDVSYFDGRYHVYYAGSVFGSDHSVIGLATNTTLDETAPGFQWIDEGLVVESNAAGASDDWNAIDPNLSFDAAGSPWMAFGSFWSGIKLRRIDPATGMLSAADPTLYALAARGGSGAIEASSIVSHHGYYYLFVSFDACCQGVNSTYRTMVGRASAITGPYTDRLGGDMLDGNAEQLLVSSGRYIGPGGGTAFQDGDCYYYVYHYYDGQANGAPMLEMRPIDWTVDDWPLLDPALWQ
jgi:arabinan endo-1,5-alpha-L-arabinosidase